MSIGNTASTRRVAWRAAYATERCPQPGHRTGGQHGTRRTFASRILRTDLGLSTPAFTRASATESGSSSPVRAVSPRSFPSIGTAIPCSLAIARRASSRTGSRSSTPTRRPGPVLARDGREGVLEDRLEFLDHDDALRAPQERGDLLPGHGVRQAELQDAAREVLRVDHPGRIARAG